MVVSGDSSNTGKWIRYGDPLSPYLFVLVMNTLSALLNTSAKKGIFKYYPKCKKVALTLLSFANVPAEGT
ncbi:hypothetical protein GQ457_02G015090 [Hibiscus cannabinus]